MCGFWCKLLRRLAVLVDNIEDCVLDKLGFFSSESEFISDLIKGLYLMRDLRLSFL